MLEISLGDELNEITILSNMEIRKAFYFMKEGFNNIERRFEEANRYKEEFRYYIEKIKNNPEILDEKTYSGSEAKEMLKRIDIIAKMYEFANDQQEIAYRMTHVFFISIYEAHIRNVLKIAFNQDQSLLVSKKTSLADISSKSPTEFKEYVNSRLDNLANVDHLEEFLDKKLRIKIIGIFAEWKSFVENFYRRHVIVHHHGIYSEKYVKKTGKPKSLIGTEIVTTFDYIKKMANNTCKLMGIITGYILSYFSWSISSRQPNPSEILNKLKRKHK